MNFTLPYKFQQSGRVVVIQHSHNGHIRVSPNNVSSADGGGGTGQFARWKIHLCGGHHVRLQSSKTGKYLRIFRNGKEIDTAGGTGPFTKFRLHYHSRPNGIKLESDRFPGRYIAVKPNRSMKIGSGGHHCNLWIKREGQPQVVKVVQRPPVIVQQGGGGGGGAFNAAYMFRKNNTIVIRSNYGKHLRVSPGNTYNCDGNGGTGKFARWKVMLDGMGVVKLQNTHSGKYLRIDNSGAVNCGGGGGKWTRFRYHVHRSPNGVKLESCQIPGKYVAIRPNGVVRHGGGGIHTQLTFLRQGAGGGQQQKVIYQQPQVIVQQPVQPQVIVQRQPQVIVQQPTYQQQIAQQQQSQQQAQMEQVRLQNEASLKAQQQQMELERQNMEIQKQQIAQQQAAMLESQRVMLQQQQQMSSLSQQASNSPQLQSEGISGSAPVNPYYGDTQVPQNEAVPSYPVLQQPAAVAVQPIVQIVQEVKEEKAAPVMGQGAANEVLQWLTQLKMERYYSTFIQNGYDMLESIGEITREDLKEMGVALGHIKIIVSASITAPFQNRKLKVRSVRYETYLSEYGKPKKMDNGGIRCILQHNEKKDKAGCVWQFELLEDNFFRLKHVPTGSWLRLMKPDEKIDTRSPFTQSSKLALEKDENAKGVYYIKEVKQDIYVKFDEPRTFGSNEMMGTTKRDSSCKINLLLIKTF